VQKGKALLVEVFSNTPGTQLRMSLQVLRQCAAFTIDPGIVSGCHDPDSEGDALFARGWRSGLASLTHAERCRVAGVTGHIAESVTEFVLDTLGWRVLWHFAGPGRHGVDLLFLTPDHKVVAVEVKGTLVAGGIPRLSRREMVQMSAAWVDKADNPGMAGLGLESADVYGAVAAVNFADLTWRVAMTADFSELRPVSTLKQLANLFWLASDSSRPPASA